MVYKFGYPLKIPTVQDTNDPSCFILCHELNYTPQTNKTVTQTAKNNYTRYHNFFKNYTFTREPPPPHNAKKNWCHDLSN